MSNVDMKGSALTFDVKFSEVESDGARLATLCIETRDSVATYWLMDYDIEALGKWLVKEAKKKPKKPKGSKNV